MNEASAPAPEQGKPVQKTLSLKPSAKSHLLGLRQKADTFAQEPVVKMSKEETIAFLNNAPIRAI